MSPTTASLSGSGVQSFTAAVSNDSSNAGVTWSIGSGVGALSASTLTGVTYTAPSTIGATTTVTLTATSKTDTTKASSAAITLNPPAAPPTITSVAASCNPASAETGQTSQCAATVTGTGSYSSTVTWSVAGVAGGNSTVGTISTTGLYTAPSAIPATNPVTVTATSVADTTKSASATVTITAPAGSPGAAGVTDSNGMVTLTSNGLTVPLQLTDQDTGGPLTGAAVALGNDPTVPGSAILLIADHTEVHPLQLVLLEGPPASSSGTAVENLALKSKSDTSPAQSGTSPTPLAVSNGCPAGSGTTASKAITLSSLAAPPSPISTQGVQTQIVAAINAVLDLDPSELPPGVFGPVSVQQNPVTSQCLTDIGNIVREHVTAKNIFLAALEEYVPETAIVLAGPDGFSLGLVTPELLASYKECWYSPSVSPLNNPVLNITSVCFGSSCILIPQLQSPPAPPTSAQLEGDFSLQATNLGNPVASVETFVSTGDLGGVVVGTTDSSGAGTVEVPLGTDTVCVDAPGYQQLTQPGFIVSAPGMPFDVTLIPTTPPQAGTYAGTCTAQGNPITCCADGQCTTVPAPPPNQEPFNFTLAPGESSSQFSSGVCAPLDAALSAAGCIPSCYFTAGTSTSASFALSCTNPPTSGCTAETVTETCSATQQ